MCGIAGWFDNQGKRQPPPHLLGAMARLIAHRGPDGEGFHVEPGVGLAHRRLAVIDLAAGTQPMWDAAGKVVISFNGEIYNFRALRLELEGLGHVFHTRSDTEVILEAWKCWGEGCVSRLEGMFAFALWDAAARTLFLARDRLGEKPLYYALLRDKSFIFASEIRALLVHPLLDRTIDPCAVEEYFSLGYVSQPRTIYSDIRKLPSASCMILRAGSAPRIWSYWNVSQCDADLGGPYMTADLEGRLKAAVGAQAVADVPLGAFLSGGIDSGTIAALLARQSSQPISCFTIGFTDPHFDESAQAALVSRQYGGVPFVQTLRGDEDDLVDDLAKIFGEPFADSSAIPALRLARMTRRQVTVALSGDGGDELFAGYRRYAFHLHEERLRAALPRSIRSALFGSLAAIYPQLDWLPRYLRARQTFLELSRDTAAGYFANLAVVPDEVRSRLYSAGFKDALQGYSACEVIRHHFAAAPFCDPLAKAQYVDIKTWLVDDILTKVDRTAMSCGLEVRVPMLDASLVQFAINLPRQLKLRGNTGKLLLRDVARQLLPPAILARPKQGFSVPLASWFRGAIGRRFEAELHGADALSNFLSLTEVRTLLHDHRSGRRDHSRVLWSCWMFDRFLREIHMDRKRIALAEGTPAMASAAGAMTGNNIPRPAAIAAHQGF